MSDEKDLAAIEELHRRDMRASKAGDFETLRSIITDEAVMMPPGVRATRGREQIERGLGRMSESMRGVEVLEYVLDFEEVVVCGDYAFEWGHIRGAMRAREEGAEVERSAYKVMRILRREADGTWKVHRSIWNDAPEESAR